MIKLSSPILTSEDIESASRVLSSAWLKQGPIVNIVQDKIASIVGSEKSLLVSSCTSALFMSLLEIGVVDKEVIVPSFGFGSTVSAIIAAGGRPVIADSTSNTPLLTYQSVKECISSNTGVILPIHMYGLPCPVDDLTSFKDEFDIEILEDTAYGLGTFIEDNHAGNIGRLGCLSFGSLKPITCGEGGAILCSTIDFNELAVMRNYGMDSNNKQKSFSHFGLNFKITEFQAALLLSQLERYKEITWSRGELSKKYIQLFKQANLWQPILKIENSNNSFFPFLLPEGAMSSSSVVEKLIDYGVEAEVPYLMHRMPAFKKYIKYKREFKWAEYWSNRVICIPFYLGLSDIEIETVVNGIEKILKRP